MPQPSHHSALNPHPNALLSRSQEPSLAAAAATDPNPPLPASSLSNSSLEHELNQHHININNIAYIGK